VDRLRVAVTIEQCWHRVPGGVGRATVATAAALDQRPDLDVVGVAAAHRPGSQPALDPPVPVVHHRLPRPVLYRSWHHLGRPDPTTRTGPVDVVWAGAMAIPPTARPLLVTVHDLAFLDHPQWSTRRGLAFFRRSWELTTARAALVVVPSVAVQADCARHGLEPERVVVVPWGTDTRPVPADEVAAVRRELGLPERFVAWVGTAEPRKNLDGLVAAMAEVDLPLVVVGPAGWLVRPAEVLAPLGSRAVVLGAIAEDRKRAVLAAATVFAFPSLAEGFGLPVLEAMAQGTAVVTSAGTATAEVAGDAAVVVAPGEVAALAAAIGDLAADDERRRVLGAAAAARAAGFTWEATAAGYRHALERALQVGGRR
jgi:glycosyltransferase involved in cell wall biosynthesis